MPCICLMVGCSKLDPTCDRANCVIIAKPMGLGSFKQDNAIQAVAFAITLRPTAPGTLRI